MQDRIRAVPAFEHGSATAFLRISDGDGLDVASGHAVSKSVSVRSRTYRVLGVSRVGAAHGLSWMLASSGENLRRRMIDLGVRMNARPFLEPPARE